MPPKQTGRPTSHATAKLVERPSTAPSKSSLTDPMIPWNTKTRRGKKKTKSPIKTFFCLASKYLHLILSKNLFHLIHFWTLLTNSLFKTPIVMVLLLQTRNANMQQCYAGRQASKGISPSIVGRQSSTGIAPPDNQLSLIIALQVFVTRRRVVLVCMTMPETRR